MYGRPPYTASTLVERAQEVIQRDRRLRVDAIRLDAFVEVMDRPPRSVAELRDLLTRETVFVD
ncbi:type II toxin -antitoxin system TacA 1-like antitoxin [Microbacterium algeriense]|uniref:type II toxin -antitoxin system TacA 1-like antitoxin n=1 Tax=Microbacterium algeriense TaxID=2615184 RepID=UPI00384D8D85